MDMLYVACFEWLSSSATRPQSREELFNLRHASLRNAIERIFGILKKRFPILSHQIEYPFEHQVKIVVALMVVANVIRRVGRKDEIERSWTPADENAVVNGRDFTVDIRLDAGRGKEFRDRIAQSMWSDYLAHMEKRPQQ
jgi:hypothetical protein